MRRFHREVRQGTTRMLSTGQLLQVRAFGLRVGYWPCLRAPFIEIAFNRKRYQFWYGPPSYQTEC